MKESHPVGVLEISDLIKGDERLATLPEVFYRLREVVDDPDCDFAQIGEIISMDPGLTVRLLRVVNSAFYGFSSEVETVTHALSIVGTEQLMQLVLATSVLSQFKGIRKDLINQEVFWKHSISCGLAARALAALTGEYQVERFFVAGLLHDIGRLVMCLRAPKEFSRALEFSQSSGDRWYRSEIKIFGFDHSEVGDALLKSWNLPERLRESVKFHHRPHAATAFPRETAVVHIADGIAHLLAKNMGVRLYAENIKIDADSWKVIELSEKLYLPLVLDKVKNQFDEVTRVFLQYA